MPGAYPHTNLTAPPPKKAIVNYKLQKINHVFLAALILQAGFREENMLWQKQNGRLVVLLF